MPLFEEEFTVSAAPEAVWDFLLDPQRVAPCLPGCESVEIKWLARFPAASSQVEVKNTLDLAPATASGTLVRYRSEVRVLGRLGSVGDAVMKVKARQLAGDFAAKVRAAIERPA